MKHTILFLAVLCAVFPVRAESLWEWQHPLPQGNDLHDVSVFPPGYAIAVGANGTVITTTNRGSSWSVRMQVAGEMGVLRAVDMIDANRAIAVGDNGLILETLDGGQTWTRLDSGTTLNLLDVDFSDENRGTAVGLDGLILRTTNGGGTWKQQNSPVLQSLMGVCFVDNNTGWAVGYEGLILSTNNGGNSWESQVSNTTGALYDVHFTDVNTGMAVGHFGYSTGIIGTLDGGLNWNAVSSSIELVPSIPSASLRAIDGSDSDHFVSVGSYRAGDEKSQYYAGIWRCTSDGGSTWSRGSNLPSYLYGVAMFDQAEGIAVGGRGNIMLIRDGGVTWEQIGSGDMSTFWMRAVDFLEAQHGLAVSTDDWGMDSENDHSEIFATADGGLTWNVSTIYGSAISDVVLANTGTAYAIGDQYSDPYWTAVIYRSTNGGANWSQLFASTSGMRYAAAIDFGGPRYGVVVGYGGHAILIRDGVASEVELPVSDGLWGVSMPTPTVVYAVGGGGLVLKSVDAGSSWTTQTIDTAAGLMDVCFADASRGTTVGTGGVIFRTEDGGENWTLQESGTKENLTRVSLGNALDGIVVAGDSLLVTSDGGATWLKEPAPIDVSDVAMIDASNVTLVGGSKEILAKRTVFVPVLFADFSAHVRADAVELTWSSAGTDRVEGYFVHRREADAKAVVVSSNMLPPYATSFSDGSVWPDTEYEYTLTARLADGTEAHSQTVTVQTTAGRMSLSQNLPNPFNPSTTIQFTLPKRGHVRLSVYDLSGRRVITLLDEMRAAGPWSVTWEGCDANGRSVGSGTYFYRLTTGGEVRARKMLLVR